MNPPTAAMMSGAFRVFSVSEIRPTIGQPIMNPINKAVISVLA